MKTLLKMVFAAATAFLITGSSLARAQEIPEGFFLPPINPTGSTLVTQELSPGVYALLSDKPPVDNSGFVVGKRGVLVIDAHMNGEMAGKIQQAVRAVTDKPILYLVNTNFHGDHTFGNYAFPAETQIIAHRKTAERMARFEEEKVLMLAIVGEAAVIADVELRLPDILFDDHLTVDLGGRVVEIHHFGPGNTPGDTVVYVSEAKAAWTGNLVLGEGLIPFLIEGDAGAHLETTARFARTLEIETIISGHGLVAGQAVLGRDLAYLSGLIDSVRKAVARGATLEETLAALPLEKSYLPAPDSPLTGPVTGIHAWNVRKTYLDFTTD